jgi:sterol 3beta-glucosyltransferase
MRIALVSAGTRGDIQPFVALAQGLASAGEEVVLAAPLDAEALVRGYGVEYRPLQADYQALMESDAARGMLANPLRAGRYLGSTVVPMLEALTRGAWEAAQGADVLVFHPKILGAPDIAERLGIPCFVASPSPSLVPTRAFPVVGAATRDLGGTLNRLSYAAVRGITIPFFGMLKRFRRDVLGLRPRSLLAHPFHAEGRPLPVLHPISEQVLPRPSDWPANAHLTGYWFTREADAWAPPAELTRFLEAGAPPVYVGFGSIAGTDPARTTALVLDAVGRSGQRAILATGWGGLQPADVPPSAHVLRSAPHEWLFARVAAVVHHGGAGTTAAGLRAGRPSVICPFFGDQPFWGARVHAIGAGPEPLPQRTLTAERLGDAIRAAAADAAMRTRAEQIGAAIRAEDGVGRAVGIIRSSVPA